MLHGGQFLPHNKMEKMGDTDIPQCKDITSQYLAHYRHCCSFCCFMQCYSRLPSQTH